MISGFVASERLPKMSSWKYRLPTPKAFFPMNYTTGEGQLLEIKVNTSDQNKFSRVWDAIEANRFIRRRWRDW